MIKIDDNVSLIQYLLLLCRLLGYGSDSKATAAPSQSKIVLVQALGGIIAGATASSITTPLDTIKTRLQVLLTTPIHDKRCDFYVEVM